MSTMVAIVPELANQLEVAPKTEVTPDEFSKLPDGGRYELIDGELRERNVSFLSTVIAGRIGGMLEPYCRERKLGWIPSSQQGYQCFPWKPRFVRMADVSFVRRERIDRKRWAEGFCTIPPDLAVEVVSPNDEVDELDEKVQEYLRAGVKLIWVIRPVFRAVQVFRFDGTVSWLWADDEITGEDVIPGFRCRVGDFFPEEFEDPVRSDPAAEAGGS